MEGAENNWLDDEKKLLLQISEGNHLAFRHLTEKYWDRLYTVGLTFLKSPEKTKDILQEVFLKVWIKRNQLPAVEKPEAWLFILTRNEIINSLKKNKLYTSDILLANDLQAEDAETDSKVRVNDLKTIIQQGLELLPPLQKKVYQLSKEEGLSHEEVCETLQLARSTVKNSLVKTLAFLRTYLQKHTDISPAIILYLLTR